jgi:hypothetical protein
MPLKNWQNPFLILFVSILKKILLWANFLFRIFETAPKIIGNKVAYAKIDPDAKAQQIKRAIDLLEKAHLLKKAKATSGAGVPLAAGASEKRYKLVF